MKKVTYLLALLVGVVLPSFANINSSTYVKVQKAYPRGVFLTTFTVDYGPYAGTYEAYADENDHTQLIKVINLQSGTKLVTGYGSPATVGNPGYYSFTFNDDPASETYGFVYEIY